jgi:hypothetical protein
VTSHVFGNAEPNVSLSLPAAAPAEYVLHTSILGSIGGFSPGSLPDHSPFCTL